MTQLLDIDTPQGVARLHVDVRRFERVTRGVVMLGHGAGGGVDAIDLVTLARALPQHDFDVIRFEQPWRAKGRKVAPAPAKLDEAWLCALHHLPALGVADAPLVVGGRSAGARVACRLADVAGAAGVLALAFPLHPPGRPERSRSEEISNRVPTLILQGAVDAFGRPEEFTNLPAAVTVSVVPAADHSFRLNKSAPVTHREVQTLIADRSLAWLNELVGPGIAGSGRALTHS